MSDLNHRDIDAFFGVSEQYAKSYSVDSRGHVEIK